jgi:putative flippase GtrA
MRIILPGRETRPGAHATGVAIRAARRPGVAISPDAHLSRLCRVSVRQRHRSGGRLPQRLLHELSAFGAVGGIAFAVDLGLFQLLYATVGVNPVAAKLLATGISMTVAFVGHRFWSFSHRARTGLRRESLRFAVINGLTLGLGVAMVALVRYPLGQESTWTLQATNVVSIGLGTVIRFLAYRHWVFPAPTERVDAPGHGRISDPVSMKA